MNIKHPTDTTLKKLNKGTMYISWDEVMVQSIFKHCIRVFESDDHVVPGNPNYAGRHRTALET